MTFLLLLFLSLGYVLISPISGDRNESKSKMVVVGANPQIYSMQIQANVSNRFERTMITSKVRNLKTTSEETTFSVILPENAFISKFDVDFKNTTYKAFTKEAKETKKIYQDAVSRGQNAAHVKLSARDSKTFTVSVNIEPESEAIFYLVYEELLCRQHGRYELVINIHPGQTIEDLEVQVHINESRPLSFVRTSPLRTGNEISKNDPKLNPSAKIDIDGNSATVKFSPSVNQQKVFGENLSGAKEKGIAGQFVVQYDVERDPKGGEVLVRDGYFAHFFAPIKIKPLQKHVVFVLDHSASMIGQKFKQLVIAMKNILSELRSKDLFNIVRFTHVISVWNSNSNQFERVNLTSANYTNLESRLRKAKLPTAAKVTPEVVDKAKRALEDQHDMGFTNIIGGLEIGLFLTKKIQKHNPKKYQPLIVFLTDGNPNVGVSSTQEITKIVTKLNLVTKVPLYSLSFGDGVDKQFLRILSAHNFGFSKHIFEGTDASLQIHDFYRMISKPLLSKIDFKYVNSVSHATKTHYPILFKGSELVVAGKTGGNSDILPYVEGVGITGPISFNTTHTKPVSSLERLWAYLTIKQILAERELTTNKTELTKKALDVSLKYSFVTDVNSIPKWLDKLRNNNENITIPQGTFTLGQSKDVNFCPKTPFGGPGECKILFECPHVLSALTNLNVYLKYFCPLNEFAGVCCPLAQGNSTGSTQEI